MKKITLLFLSCFFAAFAYGSTNMVTNGDFSDGLNGWTVKHEKAADSTSVLYTITTTDGLGITTGTTLPAGRLDFYQNLAIEAGATYTISFDYKASDPKLRLWSFGIGDKNFSVYNTPEAKTDPMRTNNGYFPVATEWTSKTMDYTVPGVVGEPSDTIHTLHLEFRAYKQASEALALTNVSVVKKETTGIHDVQNQPSVSVAGAKVYISANIGDIVSVFNLTGQTIFRTVVERDRIAISNLPNNQILVVRVGGKAFKVKL